MDEHIIPPLHLAVFHQNMGETPLVIFLLFCVEVIVMFKNQRGNIFLALFGAVALAALLSYAVSQFIRGPLTTSTNLTRVNTARQQMSVAGQLIITTSAQEANSGDCDSDGYIEPVDPADPTTNPKPTNGGIIPSTIGATKRDPWGTLYGYCAWNHGSVLTAGGCTRTYTLAGVNNQTQAVIVLVSAGKDKVFQTTCSAYVDADVNGVPDTELAAKTSGSDDLITQYTYGEAQSLGGDLWTLKINNPSVATIAKDVEIASNQTLQFADNARLLIPTDVELTDAECSGAAATQVNEKALRLNTTTNPPSLEVCYDSNAGAPYAWDWGSVASGSGGALAIDDLTDGVADYATLFNVFLGDIAGASAATGTYNTATGYQSMQGIRFGSRNTAYGASALSSNQDQDDNSAFGNSALFTLSDSGSGGNSAFGAGAAYALYDGGQTSAFGKDALYSNSSGVGNSAFGNRALYSATSGDGNTAIGVNATQGSTYVSGSVSVGHQAASNAVSDGSFVVIGADAFSGGRGSGVVAIGYQSMFYRAGAFASSAQTYNTAVGYQSLYGSSTAASNTGTSNVAIGHSVMRSTTSGTGNVAIGAQTATVNAPLYANTTGSSNVAIGQGALATNTAKSGSTAVGFEAMRYADSGAAATTYNTAVGYQAMIGSSTASANTGRYNTAIGSSSLVPLTTGNYNVAVGYNSLFRTYSQSNNVGVGVSTGGCDGGNITAIGYGAGSCQGGGVNGGGSVLIGAYTGYFGHGYNNTYVGSFAAYGNGGSFGNGNTGVGYYVLSSNTTGSGSTAVGQEAMRYVNSSAGTTYNTAVGYQALMGSTTATANTGTYNTAIGYTSMYSATSGSENTALGVSALYTNNVGQYNTAIGRAALSTTTGSNNTALGKSAGSNITTGSNNIMIGSGASAPSATASNQLNIGNSLYGDVSVHQLNLGSSTLVSGISLDVGSKTDSVRPAVGTTAQQPTCDSTRIGAMRFDTTVGSMMVCTTNGWQPLLMTSGGGGTTSTPPAGTGYFVATYTSGDGGMNGGGLSGANTRCLTDLKNYNWKNKSDAINRGLLDSSHVQAWICAASCQEALANTTYTFAAAGYTSTGGASFVTDSNGYLPGNNQDWSGSNYFGSGFTYWTGRAAGVSNLANGGVQTSCGNFTGTASSGYYGNSSGTGTGRWYQPTSTSCAGSNRLLCMVHPGNESTPTKGYFVMTDTTYDGNLGGIVGANSKCLTELTTNTNWMGYSTANSGGKLISSKVFAFICTGINGCNNLNANTSYDFALVGDSSIGGATFTTDSTGAGPGDTTTWSGSTFFGGNYDYWSDRSSSGNTLWVNSSYGSGSGQNVDSCAYWTNNSGAGSYAAYYGNTSQTGIGRWKSTGTKLCNQPSRLICFVNP